MPGKQHQVLNFLLVSLLTVIPTAAVCAAGEPASVQEATPTQVGAEVNNLVITGTVQIISDCAVLVTPHATYFLTGGYFQSIIGRTVKEGSKERLVVARAQLAGNKRY